MKPAYRLPAWVFRSRAAGGRTATTGENRGDALPHAYRECERITRQQARNFSYGIRLLPGPKRRALSAVYAFARRIDDIGDGDLPVEEKLRRLKQARESVHAATTASLDPVLAALADTAVRMPVPLEAFDELIDGCEADVRGVCYQSFDELVDYCRCVAGSVGRMSLAVFGSTEPAVARRHADALGVALQLTNILRDVTEDREAGRVYLPADELARFGVHLVPGEAFVADPDQWRRLIRFQAARAERWYADGFQLLPMLDRRSRACCAAMAGIYHQLLGRIEANPAAALATRTSLPASHKLSVAARALAGRTP